MPTNKPVVKTVDQFMSGYKPIYNPLYGAFLGKSQQYAIEAGKQDFRRIEAVGDIRAHHITPKDTVVQQISAKESTKEFKKYFFKNQYQLSHYQAKDGTDDVVAQVLDEHQRHQDDLFLLGEGTSASNMVNNGLYWSNDPNYVLETSYEVQKDSDGNYLSDLHNKVVENAGKAELAAGKKLIIFYGTTILPQFNSLYASSQKAFRASLGEVLGGDFSLAKMPADCTPSAANGWIIANLDQTKLHYTVLPGLEKNGSNEENSYYWWNFLMGSMMLEVLALNGVVRQPATLEA